MSVMKGFETAVFMGQMPCCVMTISYVRYDICSMLGMTKIKMSSEEAGSLEFVERRRAALERLVFKSFILEFWFLVFQ